MIKAILFDLDGTLADSIKDLSTSTNLALEKNGYPTRQRAEFNYFVGDGMPKMIERALPETARDEDTVKKVLADFLAHYSHHYADKTSSYEGVPELVDTLKKQGLIVAVVTNKEQDMANVVVERLYGEGTFDLIFGKQEGLPAKPDPTATLLAMKQLGVEPQECVFLGDSGVDVLTGVRSGAVPVGELWGYRDEAELLENGAQYIIERPEQLLDVLAEVQGT